MREAEAMFRPVRCPVLNPRFPAGCLANALIAAVVVGVGDARAELAWHADIQAACAASAASGKPVLAVFEATWDAGETAADVLGNSEVEAVVGACFEPVRLDVDRHADLARELSVEHIPAARVLDHEATVLTTFDCPATPSAFVAAAARAAQVAAAASTPPDTAAVAAETTDAFGSRRTAKAHETAAAVSQKVRQLANFAEGDPVIESPASRFAELASAPPAAQPVDAVVGSRYAEAAPVPALASTPPAWPAEPRFSPAPADQPEPAAPAAAPPAMAAIEPQPAPSTPWLAGTPASASAAVADGPAPLAATGPSDAAAPPSVTDGGSQPATKPATGFWATLQKPWSVFSKKPASTANTATAAVEPPAVPPTMPPARPQLPTALAASQPAADTHGPMPLGLEGYCPVTVVERGSWVEGRPQWGARHRGRTYLFAGPEQQQAFLADPDRYAPALSGDDPVLAFETGRSEPGRRAYGVSYQSRMYLFSSPESRATFTADPDRYTARVMIAEGTAPTDGIRRF
jgi:YHS domain-containing protein